MYGAQLSFPYREVRAFCLNAHGVSLIVVSPELVSSEFPRGAGPSSALTDPPPYRLLDQDERS